jgi:mono/diheme cytochrome c family protein
VVIEDHSKEIPSSKILSPGATIYNGYCASCHKEDGNGVAGSFPALNKNEIVSGDKNSLIPIILKGEAAIKPENKTQSSEQMPTFGFLNDRQIADVLTYIRSAWENHADSVSAGEVEGVRKKIK